MANTLTPLIPKAITAVQRVLRERVPLPRLVQANFDAEMAALNETITIPIVPAVAGADRTPGVDTTQAADRTATSATISMTKDRAFRFYLTGDDFKRVRQNDDFVPASITQAVRAAVNEIQSDLAALHVDAAGYYSSDTPSSAAAVGTAGTTPFGSNKDAINDLAKFLDDSLAPDGDRFLMLDTAARAAAAKLSTFVEADKAGVDQTLRQGIIGMVDRFNIVMAHDVKLHTAGTGSGYLVNNGGGYAAGTTSIEVDTGSGTILEGDIVTIGSRNYVAASDLSGTTLTLTSGLVEAVADNASVTVVTTDSRRNMAFHREAIGLAVRPSANPPQGDSAADATIITDPESGLSFRLAEYRLYGQVQWELQATWGAKVLRPELLKILLG